MGVDCAEKPEVIRIGTSFDGESIDRCSVIEIYNYDNSLNAYNVIIVQPLSTDKLLDNTDNRNTIAGYGC